MQRKSSSKAFGCAAIATVAISLLSPPAKAAQSLNVTTGWGKATVTGKPVSAHAQVYDMVIPTFTVDPPFDCGTSTGEYPVCQTDNSNVSYFMRGSGDLALEEGDKDGVRTILANEFQPTHLTIQYDSTPIWTGTGETDWIYEEGPVSGTDRGVTVCDDEMSGWKCDQHYIRIEGGGFYGNLGLVCHETGHATGLVHGDAAWMATSREDPALGCMQKPTESNDRLRDLQVSNINDVY